MENFNKCINQKFYFVATQSILISLIQATYWKLTNRLTSANCLFEQLRSEVVNCD